MKLKVGKKVRVKIYDDRPFRWNGIGKMDKFMGEIVTIRSLSPRVTIEEDNRWEWSGRDSDSNKQDYWSWQHEDFEPIIPICKLDEELFEI